MCWLVQRGVVKKISEDSVIIEEIFTDFYGRKKSKRLFWDSVPKRRAVDEDNYFQRAVRAVFIAVFLILFPRRLKRLMQQN